MYAAKLLLGIATLVLSGSLWFVPSTLYVITAIARSVREEDADLERTLAGYAAYRQGTWSLVPWLF